MLTATNLVVILVHHAALMQILAILIGAAGARIEAKAKCLAIESSGPLVALTTRIRAFVASFSPAFAVVPLATPTSAQTFGGIATQLLQLVVRIVLGQSGAENTKQRKRHPAQSCSVSTPASSD